MLSTLEELLFIFVMKNVTSLSRNFTSIFAHNFSVIEHIRNILSEIIFDLQAWRKNIRAASKICIPYEWMPKHYFLPEMPLRYILCFTDWIYAQIFEMISNTHYNISPVYNHETPFHIRI